MGSVQHDLPQLFILLDTAPHAEQGHTQGCSVTPVQVVRAMHTRGLEVGDEAFAPATAMCYNALVTMWLRAQMLETLIRRRGHNCQKLNHPFQFYYPIAEGSVHRFESTGVHYSRTNMPLDVGGQVSLEC